MANILTVGIATLDIINSVTGYPAEDDEVRATHQRICRGGNATNTLAVLSQLGHNCAWAGVLANEPDARHIEIDLEHHQIDISAVIRQASGKVPTSYITHNTENGSRSIIHYRDLPEYPFSAFEQIELEQFDWLHFEGRNISETEKMLRLAKSKQPNLPCSIEIEKERDNIEQLFSLADMLLFSKPFAEERGFKDGPTLFNAIRSSTAKASLVCTWGNAGAWAQDSNSNTFHSPAFPPTRVLDTLGAGDTFNAGIIDACVKGFTLDEALERACRLAGIKCGHYGLDCFDSEKP